MISRKEQLAIWEQQRKTREEQEERARKERKDQERRDWELEQAHKKALADAAKGKR